MSSEPSPIPEIVRRKSDHIDIVLGSDVGFGRVTSGFDQVRFVHCALPELDLDAIDLRSALFGRAMAAPFLISSMTGGPARAQTINRHLAETAARLGLALAVGSQRVALEDVAASGIGRDLRQIVPGTPLIGNIGGAQIRGLSGVDQARRAIDMIGADGLFVHLNPLQEAVQADGDRDWRGVLQGIAQLVRAGVPIAVKEVGFGLSGAVVAQLVDAGVTVIDVAGAGGTNWARVEGARALEGRTPAVAEAFAEWGIPTATALRAARAAAPDGLLIASGGIANGIDAAKAIRLGADIVGQAARVLGPALESADAVTRHFDILIETLRVACFCTGSADLRALRQAPLLSG